MKKIVKSILVSGLLVVSVQADFLMKLTDKNGVEESLCVKSYSFSNNLESIHKQENQTIDEYSTKETLTNKLWKNKPVYRKIITANNYVGNTTNTPALYSISDIKYDEFVKVDFVGLLTTGAIYSSASTMHESNSAQARTLISKNKDIVFISNYSFSKIDFILEYTKTTDSAIANNSELTTLINYLPSNSDTGEYQVKSLDEVGVQIFKNYTYDSSTGTCVAPNN